LLFLIRCGKVVSFVVHDKLNIFILPLVLPFHQPTSRGKQDKIKEGLSHRHEVVIQFEI